MEKKSKGIAFLLSIIPGFGHFYLGLFTRGLLFIFAIVIDFIIAMTLTNGPIAYLGYRSHLIGVMGIPLIWLVAEIDCIHLVDKINNVIMQNKKNNIHENDLQGDFNINEENTMEYKKINPNNKLLVSMFLSIIPGAGHMYLGLMRKGIELMATFFLAFYLTDFLRISIFTIAAPIIWFYSMFDVMHKVSVKEELDKNEMVMLNKIGFTKNYGKMLGIGFIVVGGILILQQMAFPLVNQLFGYEIAKYVRTAVIAIIFIAGGIKLSLSNKGGQE